MSEEQVKVLQTSDDPKELMRAAAGLAASAERADHDALLRSLRSGSFLLRLNAAEEYAADPRRLRIKHVLEALAGNKAAPAQDTLLELTKSAEFISEPARVDLLIKVSAGIRPPPKELIAFWDKHCQPEDGFGALSIDAMLENDSNPSIELFEKKMTEAAQPEDDKRGWMRSSLLMRRNSARLLAGCERLLKGNLPGPLKADLVEAIFDYKPAVWYTPAVNYTPPPLSSYTTSARTQLRMIGQYALDNLTLNNDQRQAVQVMLGQLERPATGGPANP